MVYANITMHMKDIYSEIQIMYLTVPTFSYFKAIYMLHHYTRHTQMVQN